MFDRVPRKLVADAYTIGSGTHVSQDAKDYSAYQLVFRKAPDWMADLGCEHRFIFHGFQRIVREIICPRVTLYENEQADEFLKTFHANGEPFSTDASIFERVSLERNGILPIRIWALKDGATCFPGEPVCQVEAMEGFGELGGYFESKLLQVWAPSERATLMRHWLDYNKQLVNRCVTGSIPDIELNMMAALMTHDFGDRASSCSMESEVLGMAHLTSHFGTDTVAGAYRAWEDTRIPIGKSIKALAHRIVQGYEDEKEAYLSLYESDPNTFTSHVADCYDFYNAVDKYLIPLAKKAKETGGVIVVRPDSGDPLKQILYALDAAVKAGLYEHMSNGLKGMTSLRVIQGDGMTFKTIMEINQALFEKAYSPFHCVVYGVGGFLRNVISRDNFGATLKLCSVGAKRRPVMKFSHTPGKESVPGLVKVCRQEGQPTVRSIDEPGLSEMVLWYDGIDGDGLVYQESFSAVRDRVLDDFHKFPYPKDIFSETIKLLKKDLRAKYVEGSTLCETKKENTLPLV